MRRLRNKILADPYNSIIFSKGRGKNLHLVGGYVRDILRGVISQDRDYILSGSARSFADEIRKITKGTLVEFKKGDLTRIAFKDGVTLDFSRITGTLEEDLSKRDFTINAIAWSPDRGIIDPYNGSGDIKDRKIRSLSEGNLIADPLRMLRAYRFAADLNGSIERNTRKAIKKLHALIKKTSPERITLELFNILNTERPSKYLKMAFSDGILKDILFIPTKNLEHNIKAISTNEAQFKKLPLKVKVSLKRVFSQSLSYRGLLMLELLFMEGPKSMEKMTLIKTSKDINKRMILTHRGIKKFKKEKLFDIFLESKEAAMDILILKGRAGLLKEYDRFKRVWRKGLLRSGDIIKIAKIRTGQRLGRVIIELKKAQFEKRIKNKKDAMRFIRSIKK